jgi:phospholipase/carboxylesterase
MRVHVLLLLALLGVGCDAKGDAPAASPSLQAQSQARAEVFEPPDAQGWGRVGRLHYLERCLGGGKPDAALPLVIMIHGLGDHPRPDWFPGAELIRTPLRLIMPQAPTPFHRGYAWFPYRIGDNDPVQLARGIAAAERELAQAIDVVRARRPTVGQPIVTGFSQGGMLSYALALLHPAQFALSLPISGMLPAPLWPASKQAGTRYPPIRGLHGDADDIVPIDGARELVAHLRGLGFDAELHEVAGERHWISGEMVRYSVDVLDRAARQASGR